MFVAVEAETRHFKFYQHQGASFHAKDLHKDIARSSAVDKIWTPSSVPLKTVWSRSHTQIVSFEYVSTLRLDSEHRGELYDSDVNIHHRPQTDKTREQDP